MNQNWKITRSTCYCAYFGFAHPVYLSVTRLSQELHAVRSVKSSTQYKKAYFGVFIGLIFYRVVHGGLLAIWGCKERPICQVKLRTLKKRYFPLFLLGRVEISVSFIQNVVEN
jgi:hypothetical protein